MIDSFLVTKKVTLKVAVEPYTKGRVKVRLENFLVKEKGYGLFDRITDQHYNVTVSWVNAKPLRNKQVPFVHATFTGTEEHVQALLDDLKPLLR